MHLLERFSLLELSGKISDATAQYVSNAAIVSGNNQTEEGSASNTSEMTLAIINSLNSCKKRVNGVKSDQIVDREKMFQDRSATSISYTLGGKLKRKIREMKEKFEFDISDQQN